MYPAASASSSTGLEAVVVTVSLLLFDRRLPCRFLAFSAARCCCCCCCCGRPLCRLITYPPGSSFSWPELSSASRTELNNGRRVGVIVLFPLSWKYEVSRLEGGVGGMRERAMSSVPSSFSRNAVNWSETMATSLSGDGGGGVADAGSAILVVSSWILKNTERSSSNRLVYTFLPCANRRKTRHERPTVTFATVP